MLLALLLAAAPLAAQDDELPFGKRKVRDLVVGQLSEMTGREMTIAGDIDIDLGWQPSMRIEQVRVANAAWGRAEHLLRLDALEVQIDMRALLNGDVRLPRLALIGPKLHLEVSEQGDANWVLGGEQQTVVEAAAAPEGEPGNLPVIDQIEVHGGEIRYLDHRDETPRWVEGHIDEAGGSLDAEGVDVAASGSLGAEPYSIVLRTASLDDLRRGEDPSPIYLIATAGAAVDGPRVDLDGRFRGATVAAELSADPLPRLLTGERYALQGQVAVGDSSARVDALIRSPPDLDELRLDLALSGDIEQLAELTGAPLPALPPVEAEGLLLRDGPIWTAEGLDIVVGASDLSGQVRLDFSGPRPQVDADLESDTIDWTTLLPESGKATEPPADDELPVPDLLTEIDARLAYEADRMLTGGPTITGLALDTRLENGRLRLGPLRLDYRQPEQQTRLALRLRAVEGRADEVVTGAVRGQLRGNPINADLRADGWVDLTDEAPPGSWRLRLTPAQTEIVLAGTLTDLLSPATLDLNVRASGPSPAELSDLIGVPLPDLPPYTLTLDLERDGPRLVLKDLDARVGDSDLDGRIAVDFANEPADVAIDLSSDWLDIETLAVDTVDTLFVGGGDIDLDRERLNLVIEARPKDQSLPAFSSPLRLQGPLTDPSLDLVSAELLARGALAVGLVAAQPLTALLPLIEPGGGAGSPYCDGLMEAMRAARREVRR